MPFIVDDRTLIAWFGSGDIAMAAIHFPEQGTGTVSFAIVPPGEVGRNPQDEVKAIPPEDLVVPLRMVFDGVKALDVVMDAMRELRAEMAAGADEEDHGCGGGGWGDDDGEVD